MIVEFLITTDSPNPTLVIVIFHSENKPPGSLGTGNHQALVNGLQSEGVNDTNIDAFPLESVVGGQGLVQSHTSTYHSHLVTVRLSDNLERNDEKINN